MSRQSISSSTDDLQLALDLADTASALALDFFTTNVEPRHKADGTVVTQADLAVERMLSAALASVRPNDAIVGEEFGAAREGSRRWIIDPIDGTKNFVTGRSDWGVHLALEEQGEVLLGVVTRPVLGRRWWAGRGHGAFVGSPDGKQTPTSLHVSDKDSLAHAHISAWVVEDEPLEARLRSSSAWVEAVDLDTIMLVAEGRIEALVDATRSEIWDRAPLVVIVEEAGGRYRDRRGGRDLDLPGGLFTNGRVDDELDRLLAL